MHDRVYRARVAAELGDSVAHGREIDYYGHAREILQRDTPRHVGEFCGRLLIVRPRRDQLYIGIRCWPELRVAERVLQQHSD